LPSFNRPNTHLIDTDGQGVTEITEKGIVANGIEYEVDVIIYASGYTFAKGATNAVNFPVIGADGRRLQDHWKDGLRSLHGMHVNGFPNMFVVQLAQGADFIPAISVGWQKCGQTIATVVGHMQAQGHDRVEAKAEDEAAWSTIIATAPPVPDTSDCTPGLLSHEGETDPRIASLSGSPDGPRAFFAMMESWKANGRFEGLSFGKAA
jgi:cation diffusion facilitator CzcD-associated flavoprotein CzcO